MTHTTSGIARNTYYSLLTQASTSVFTMIATLVLVRVLGPDGFGTFSLGLALTSVISIVAMFGVRGSLARFVAEYRTDLVSSSAMVRSAFRIVLLTSIFSALVLFLAAPRIAIKFGDDELMRVLRVLAVSLVAETLFLLVLSTFIALARMSVNFRLVLLESFVEITAILTFVLLGAGAAGAAAGRATGYAVGAALGVFAIHRFVGKLGRRDRGAAYGERWTRQILRYAAPLLVLDGLYVLYSRIDVILIGALLSPEEVGIFSAAARLTIPLASVGLALANSIAPRQSVGVGEGRVNAFVASIRGLSILHALIIVPLVVWAEPIVRILLGPEYSDSAPVLRWLAPCVFLAGLAPLVSTTVNFLGRAGRRIPIAAAALAIDAAIDLVLLKRVGVVAAAGATAVALLIYVGWHLWICWKELKFDLGPVLLSLVRPLIAAVATAGVLLVVAGSEPSSVGIALLAASIGFLAFCVVLAVTGEVSIGEARRAGHWLVGWRRRVPRN